MEVLVDVSEIKELSKVMEIFPKQMRASLVRAINRTIPTVQSAIAKDVTAEYETKQKDVKAVQKVQKASSSNPVGMVTVSGMMLKLSRFKYKPTNTPNTRAKQLKGVQIKIKKQGSYRKSASQPPLFVAKGEVMQRKEAGEYGIGWGFTLGIPQMVSSDQVYSQIKTAASQKLQQEIERDLDYRLSKLQRGR